MNQNWIVENLLNAFATWNSKLSELWALASTSPQSFKGGAVWGVMQGIHSGLLGIGYGLLILFFALSLFKNTANFHELKRPEAALHYLIRFVAAKTLVDYSMTILLAIFDICNGVILQIAGSMGGMLWSRFRPRYKPRLTMWDFSPAFRFGWSRSWAAFLSPFSLS